jgi:AraC-like DNA-binding protein
VTPPLNPDTYVEHAPPASLRDYVECFWTRAAQQGPNEANPVLPDGAMDIVLGYPALASGEPPAVGLAVGTMTRPLLLGRGDRHAFVGVRFWPGRALPFLGLAASELTDLRVDIADVWPHAATALEALPARDVAGVLAQFERLLRDRLRDARPLDRTVDGAVRAILRAGGNVSIASLAPALGVTRQHLARAFALHVGVPPKMFARVTRMRRAIAKARVAARVDWAALAIEAGYYDQAHLAGEIRELTGRSPTEWLAST